jgi:aryl-alcohol dehydrogenase-like predicted oxidoreductase
MGDRGCAQPLTEVGMSETHVEGHHEAPTRKRLGARGLLVSPIGLGCMTLDGSAGDAERAAAIGVIDRALELGVTFFDTADIYGGSEDIVGQALRRRRDDVVIATKFGLPLDRSGAMLSQVDGRPEYVRGAVERSLARLGIDHIDLYYQHRVDPAVPIEDTVGAMAELVAAGKVRYLGLSEPGPGTIRRAHATHPISAIQSEWSVFSRDIEDEVVPVARELGIGLVPYSPLGRGLLTGAVQSQTDVSALLQTHPRYSADTFDHNLALVDVVRAVAERHGVAPGQVALAWVLHQGADVVPIPGTRHTRYLEQNVAAADLHLDDDDLQQLDVLSAAVRGHRSFDASRTNAEAPLPT